MTTTHEAGPLVVFGQSPGGPTPDYNPDLGTSLIFGGTGLLDQRGYWAYNPGNLAYQGWVGSGDIYTLNFVPSALATGNITNNAVPVTTVALTITPTANAGIISAAALRNAATGAVVTGLRVIDALTAAATGSISANVFTAASGATGTFTVGTVLSGLSGNTPVQVNTTIIGLLTGT